MQKSESEVNNDINSRFFFVKETLPKLNVDVIVNSVNKMLIRGGGIDGAIQETADSGLIDECQNLNGYETDECKVTQGH